VVINVGKIKKVFYDDLIKVADARFSKHLNELKKEK